MKFSKVKRNNIIVCLIIGICFLWTGSSYISWLYNVIDIIEANHIPVNVDALSEVTAYIVQAIGLLSTGLFIRKTNMEFSKGRTMFMLAMLAHVIFVFPSILTNSFVVALVTGYIMNILVGIIAAFYLIMLVEQVPTNNRGLVFGLGYSIGSIGSWILSLIGDGNFLRSDAVLIAYLLLMAVTIGLLLMADKPEIEVTPITKALDYNKSLIFLSGLAVLLLCAAKGIGFYFPMADISSGDVSLELSRAYYAIGLIVAGILNDYKRIYGGIACIAALMFPFVLLFMTSNPQYSLYTWILGYVFIAFYTIFRVIIFSDLADRTSYGLYLATMGLMWGRLGDALGAAIGIILGTNTILIIVTGSVLFAITLVLCFYIFQKIYYVAPSPVATPELPLEQKIDMFANYHDLSTREKEVLPLILDGHSNSEISGLLFVSENTVKFHVRNILKKTGCANRQELAKSFQNYI